MRKIGIKEIEDIATGAALRHQRGRTLEEQRFAHS